jgi:hypothetical protein
MKVDIAAHKERLPVMTRRLDLHRHAVSWPTQGQLGRNGWTSIARHPLAILARKAA